MSTSYDLANWYFLGQGYAQGADKSTAGKPLYDGNFDKVSATTAQKIRKQNHYLNVNGTDIPAIVSKNTARVIGISVNIQVESKFKNFNMKAEKFIENFKKLGVGELTGKHHFNSACRAMSDFDMLDGGFMIRHHYSNSWAIPYKYELVGVDMIDISKCSYQVQDKKEGYTLNGIVYNKWNQITHIWMYKTDDKRKSEKVNYDNITYYSEVWVSIGQQTAISKLSSILPTIDQISQYGKAELENAIESAKAGAYLKSTAYNEIMEVLRAEINKATGSGAEAIDSAIELAAPILKKLANAGISVTGLTPIPSGDEVQFDPRTRDGVYDQLNSNSEMKIGSALGMSDLTVYSKAGSVNYSAMKYVSEMDQLSADIKFDNLSRKAIDEIIKRAIRIGIQIAEIPERINYWANPNAFNKFRYLRQKHIDIEPAKTAAANKTNLAIEIKRKAQIIEERDGVPYDVFLSKQLDEKKQEINLKLDLEEYEKAEREKRNLEPILTEEEKKNENSTD